MSTNMYGYLTWWTVGELAAPYTALNKLASQVGFPADCVPAMPSERNIWEKAANVGGSRGLEMEVSQDMRYGTILRYGVEPTVRLLTRRVSDKAPLLCRHLVREAVIPHSPTHRRQLSLQTVAVLEFDCTANRANAYQVDDTEGWINGNLAPILAEITVRQQTLKTVAEGQDVREGIRKLLLELYRVPLRNNGGVYFVPETAPDARAMMQALRAYINGLAAWTTGLLHPSCSVVLLRDDEASAFDIRQDIIASTVEALKDRLQGIVNRLSPVLEGTARDAEKTIEHVNADLVKVNAEIAAYKASLNDDFAALGDMFEMVNLALDKAYQVAA